MSGGEGGRGERGVASEREGGLGVGGESWEQGKRAGETWQQWKRAGDLAAEVESESHRAAVA